ncbi:MAG: hypothetical protein Q8R36_05110 [bacterium]|nr:hypothetical protein [bacterium]
MNQTFSKSRPTLFVIFLCTVVFLFYGFVFAVNAAEDTGLIPCGQTIIGPDGKSTASPCTFDHFIQLIQNVINFLLVTVAIPLATVLFSYAGWLYLSVAGDEGNVKKAHQIFINVIFGLALALAAWLIVNTLANALLDDNIKSKVLFLKQSATHFLPYS